MSSYGKPYIKPGNTGLGRVKIRVDVEGYEVGAISLPREPEDLWLSIDTMISGNPLAWCLLSGYARFDGPAGDIRQFPGLYIESGKAYVIDQYVTDSEEYPVTTLVWVAYLDHLACVGWQDDMGDVGGFVTDRFDLGHERYARLRAMFSDLRDIQTVDLYRVPDRYGRKYVRDLRWRTSAKRLCETEDLRDGTIKASTLNQRDEG